MMAVATGCAPRSCSSDTACVRALVNNDANDMQKGLHLHLERGHGKGRLLVAGS
jgi:hypothetical protein